MEQRLIDANAFSDLIESYGVQRGGIVAGDILIQDVLDFVEDAPTVDAEPVKHGHWIKNEWGEQTCSCCQGIVCKDTETCIAVCQYDYCPGCGAKMDGDVTSND